MSRLRIRDHAGERRGVSLRLWTINRWLRYTGLRVFVATEAGEDGWTRIGVAWYGLPGSAGWRRIESPPASAPDS